MNAFRRTEKNYLSQYEKDLKLSEADVEEYLMAEHFEVMFAKMRVGSKKYGKLTWRGLTREQITDHLAEEVSELVIAIENGNVEDMREEAADVSNLAWMVADWHDYNPDHHGDIAISGCKYYTD